MIKKIEFETSLGITSNISKYEKENKIVFVGRSNVGKSSLLNYIFNNKKLAKVGSKPGKTKLLNFFKTDKNGYIVDIPGYGYAKLSKKENDEIEQLLESFFSEQNKINLVLLLIDSRIGFTEDDQMMFDYLMSKNIPIDIIFTKIDKISKNMFRKNQNSFELLRKTFPYNKINNVFYSSSGKKIGGSEILKEIEKNINGQ